MALKRGLPKWGELVLCRVRRITPYAAWCELEEYVDESGRPVEGMIHVSEVAGKWVRDIRDFVKINKQYVAKIVRVDYQKRHLNLSLKRVSKYDKQEKMNAFKNEKRADRMLEQLAKKVGASVEEAYEKVGYPLQERYDNIFSAFESANDDPAVLREAGVPQKWIEALQEIFAKSFKKKEIVLKAELRLTTIASDGVNKIKSILGELSKTTGSVVTYISAPIYRVELKTKEPKEGEKKLRKAMDAAIEKIKSAEGEGSYEFVK